MATHNETGKKGEEAALKHLQAKGYQILAQNWLHRQSEIDLIAEKEGFLVFAEVKTRTGNFFGYPEEFVSAKKEELFSIGADEFIYRRNHQGECRFDIISVTFNTAGQITQIHHIEDAFFPR